MTKLEEIKEYLRNKVDNIKEEDIIKREDTILMIEYYSVRFNSVEVLVPASKLDYANEIKDSPAF